MKVDGDVWSGVEKVIVMTSEEGSRLGCGWFEPGFSGGLGLSYSRFSGKSCQPLENKVNQKPQYLFIEGIVTTFNYLCAR